jgi:hypothetical protein
MKNQFAVLLLALTCLGGCITRPGMNTDCEWPPEASRPRDLGTRAAERHLIEDAELAEELAVRYNDRWARGIEPCEAKLFSAIGQMHNVTPAEVEQARARINNKGLDLPVNLPMTVLFLWAAVKVTRWVRRRFTHDETYPRMTALVFASVGLSGVWLLLGELWASTILMIRVGDQHVGGRAVQLPWAEPHVGDFRRGSHCVLGGRAVSVRGDA